MYIYIKDKMKKWSELYHIFCTLEIFMETLILSFITSIDLMCNVFV